MERLVKSVLGGRHIPALPPLAEKFNSVVHPSMFLVDWATYYSQAYARGQALRATTRHEAGLRYGEDPAHTMNVFHPAFPRGDGTVLVFMHGGAFSEGHPDFCDFVGERLLANGITFVSMGYRVAPTRFPDSAGDVARGLAFLDAHLGREEGVPRRYCLAGHSAGGSIAALLGVRPDLTEGAGMRAGAIEAMVLISGIYDFSPPDPAASFVDESRRPQASAVLHAAHAPPRTLLIYGDPEVNRKANSPDLFKVRALLLEGALRSHGHEVQRLAMPDGDHVATALAFDDDTVFQRVMGVLPPPPAQAA